MSENIETQQLQNDEISFTCHGKPNKREFALNQIRSPAQWLQITKNIPKINGAAFVI